ncbi:hypothetical protein EJB05_48287, partial [Eragrostis curvula]
MRIMMTCTGNQLASQYRACAPAIWHSAKLEACVVSIDSFSTIINHLILAGPMEAPSLPASNLKPAAAMKLNLFVRTV